MILLGRCAECGPTTSHFFTAPTNGFATKPSSLNPSGQSVVLLDRGEFDALIQAMQDDDTDTYLAEHPDAGLPDERSVS